MAGSAAREGARTQGDHRRPGDRRPARGRAVDRAFPQIGRPVERGAAPEKPTELRKHHGLQGPIDDAFIDSFVFVRPTGKPLNDTVGEWVPKRNRARDPAVAHRLPRRRPRRGRHSGHAGDDREFQSGALGRSVEQRGARENAAALPVKWSASAVSIGKASYPAANHAPMLIYPNPLNPKQYVVLNSSFTFRQGSDTTNALQTPKLPDWALVDLRTPPMRSGRAW